MEHPSSHLLCVEKANFITLITSSRIIYVHQFFYTVNTDMYPAKVFERVAHVGNGRL